MKRYGSLLLLIFVTFVMLANNFLPSNTATSFSALGTATKTPTKRATKTPTKKPTKIPTKIPTKTPTKKPTNTSVKPIIEEVHYWGPQSPWDGVDQTPCENITSPIVLREPVDVIQLESLELILCGWALNKDVFATILKPDGTTKIETLRIYPFSDSGLIELHYSPTVFDPVGNYEVNFSNDEQSLGVEFMVSRVTEPGAILSAEDHELQVYNFLPYEKIRIFQYDLSIDYLEWGKKVYQWRLKDWQERETGRDGNLRFSITDIQDTYVVIGEITGEYNTDRGSVRIGSVLIKEYKSVCPEASASRVEVGSTTRVTTPTRIREQPTISARIKMVLPKETLFMISTGYECNDGYTWWYGVTDTGIEGWMAESQNGVYLLEPVP